MFTNVLKKVRRMSIEIFQPTLIHGRLTNLGQAKARYARIETIAIETILEIFFNRFYGRFKKL